MLSTARYHLEMLNGRLDDTIDLEVRINGEWMSHQDIKVGRPRRFRFVDSKGQPGVMFGTLRGLFAEVAIWLSCAR